MQNMYCWLLAFNELSSIFLAPRRVMQHLGFMDSHPQLFTVISVVFSFFFMGSRGAVLSYRFWVHARQCFAETSGAYPEADLANRSLAELAADMVMNSLSWLLNIYWLSLILPRFVKVVCGRSSNLKLVKTDTLKST